MIVDRRQADIAVDDRIALVREGAEQIVVELTRIGGVEAEDQARSTDRLDIADEAVRLPLGRLRQAQPDRIDRPSRDIERIDEESRRFLHLGMEVGRRTPDGEARRRTENGLHFETVALGTVAAEAARSFVELDPKLVVRPGERRVEKERFSK